MADERAVDAHDGSSSPGVAIAHVFRPRSRAFARTAAILYTTALLVGTHWPRLQIGPPDSPSDKMLHYLAFGGLAVAWYIAIGRRRAWACAIGSFLLALVIEFTQTIPGLGRSFDSGDLVAGGLGAFSAGMVLAALRPVGGVLARRRRRRFDESFDALLARGGAWMTMATGAALGILLGGPLVLMLDRVFSIADNPVPLMLVGAALGAGSICHFLLETGTRAMRRRLDEAHACTGCGFPMSTASPGTSACPVCGREHAPDAWEPIATVSNATFLRLLVRPMVQAAGIGLVFLVAWFALLVLRNVAGLNAIWRAVNGIDAQMQTIIDASFLALLVSFVVVRVRAAIADRVDRQATTCLGCEHDLTGLPDGDDAGRCPECGATFRRAAA